MSKNFLFTSESVSDGHPDKICDFISDRILDFFLTLDRKSRVACECFIGYDHKQQNGYLIVGGEVRSQVFIEHNQIPENLKLKIQNLALDALTQNIGYQQKSLGFDPKQMQIEIRLNTQSEEISKGVEADQNKNKDLGAGDQGLMFGFAHRESNDRENTLMPLPILMAHALLKELKQLRTLKRYKDYLFPDAKSQVTIGYENNQPVHLESVVLSSQHSSLLELEELRNLLKTEVIQKVADQYGFNTHNTHIFINSAGEFHKGGPISDTGLTGRKIIVDSYGGFVRHGGGAFSGKDGTKVDRSGAYIARNIAKHFVALNIMKSCEIQISYLIGQSEPISLLINPIELSPQFPSNICLEAVVRDVFPLKPHDIIEYLKLETPHFSDVSNFGHFGNQLNMPWEKTSFITELERKLNFSR